MSWISATNIWETGHFLHIHLAACIYIAIGLLQIALAILGAIVSIRSLPKRSTNAGTRRAFFLLFLFFGAALLAFTVLTGILNDKSQTEADQRANDSNRRLVNLQTGVDKLLNLNSTSYDALLKFTGSINLATLTQQQKDLLIRARNTSEQARAASATLQSVPAQPTTTYPRQASTAPTQPGTAQTQPGTPTKETSIQFPPPPPPGSRTPPRNVIDLRKRAVETAEGLIEQLQKQDSEIANELTGPDGIATQQRSATRPPDVVLPVQVQARFKSFETRYPVVDQSKVALISFALDSLQGGAIPTQTAQKLRDATYKPARPFTAPQTVGDLTAIQPPTFREFEDLLRSASGMIRVNLYLN